MELESQQPCLVLSYGDRVVLWEIAQGLWNPCQMPKSPLRSIIMDNLYHLPCAQRQRFLAIERPIYLRGVEIIEGHHLALICNLGPKIPSDPGR